MAEYAQYQVKAVAIINELHWCDCSKCTATYDKRGARLNFDRRLSLSPQELARLNDEIAEWINVDDVEFVKWVIEPKAIEIDTATLLYESGYKPLFDLEAVQNG